jgi:hypothetical protein
MYAYDLNTAQLRRPILSTSSIETLAEITIVNLFKLLPIFDNIEAIENWL